MSVITAPMSKDEAQGCAERIRKGLDGIRADVFDLHEREGWKALGYVSWRDCVTQEFEHSERHLYRLLSAARVEQNIQEIDQLVKTLPESQTRELQVLEPEQQRLVWQAVKATAPNGEPTAAHVKSLVTIAQDLERVGAIDDGTGEMVAWEDLAPNQKLALLKANAAEETHERNMRQDEQIKARSEVKNGQGHLKPEEKARRGLSDTALRVIHETARELTGWREVDRNELTKLQRECAKVEGFNELSKKDMRKAVIEAAGVLEQGSIKSSRPKPKAPYRTADAHLRALVKEFAPNDKVAEFERFWGAL